jgi:hypothetical protein
MMPSYFGPFLHKDSARAAELSRPAPLVSQSEDRMAKPDSKRMLKFIAFAIFLLIVIGLMLNHSLHRP